MVDNDEENEKNDELSIDENVQAIDGEIIENEKDEDEELKQEKENNHADTLAIISLGCILIPTVITMSIGIILLIYTRIKYPNNKFSKVVVGIGCVFMVISMIVIYVMLMRCMNSCATVDCNGCVDTCTNFPG